MIRLLFILIVAGLAALGAAWIADHDAVLTLNVADYEIRTTAAVAILLLLLCFALLWLVLRTMFAILRAFAIAGGWFSGKRRPVPVQANVPHLKITAAQDP